MYIRFAGPRRVPHLRAAPGLFHALHYVPGDPDDDWRLAEVWRVYRWFCEELRVPRAFERRFGHGWRHGICWFRDDAARHVSEARYLAWLLSDIGLPIEELRSPRPGAVIWQDDHQIVAIPDRRADIRVH